MTRHLIRKKRRRRNSISNSQSTGFWPKTSQVDPKDSHVYTNVPKLLALKSLDLGLFVPDLIRTSFRGYPFLFD